MVIAAVLGLVTLVTLVGWLAIRKKGTAAQRVGWGISALVSGIAMVICTGATVVYFQDPGQAVVQRSFTGDIVDQTTTEGTHFKAPWVDIISYDIRNQQVIFGKAATENDHGSSGPAIAVQDREGVTANIGISVRYSVEADAVTKIYRDYQTQEGFVGKFVENDIRGAVRTVPAKYGTLELLNSRADVEQKIVEYLRSRWEKAGVQVDNVTLQDIDYPQEVRDRFDEAQKARIGIETAKADLEAKEIEAQQKVKVATAEAEANRILTQSLSDQVLKQRYLDTLSQLGQSGNLVVVPDGFNGILNLQK